MKLVSLALVQAFTQLHQVAQEPAVPSSHDGGLSWAWIAVAFAAVFALLALLATTALWVIAVRLGNRSGW